MPTPHFKTFLGAATCGLLLIVPFIFHRGLVDYANLPQTVFIQTVSLVLMLAGSIHIAFKGRVALPRTPVSCLVLLFLLWVLLSLFWATNRYEGLIAFLHVLSCGIVFFMVSNFTDQDNWLERILLTVVWAGFGIALLGCAQHLFKISWIPQQVPPAATFGNKNVGSEVVSMILPLLPVLAFLPTRNKTVWVTKIISPLVGLVCFAYLFFTVTRAAWLASVVSLSFVTIAFIRDAARRDSLARISRRTVFSAALLFVLFSGGVLLFTPKAFQNVVNLSRQKLAASLNQRASLDIRLAMWKNGVEMFKERPLYGYGPGNFKIFYPAYHRKVAKDPVFSETRQPLNIHNDFMQAGIELGLGGFLAFSGLFASGLYMTLRLFGRTQPPEIRLMAAGLGGGLVAMCVTAFFGFPAERAIPSLLLFTYMGMLAAYYDRHIPGYKVRVFSVPRQASIFGFAAVLCVGVFVTLFNYNRVAGEVYHRKSLEMARTGVWPETIRAGLKACEANPRNMGSFEAVGWAYVQMNETGKGIESLKQVLEAYPYNIKAMRELGEAYYRAGNVEKALEAFKSVIEIKPESPRVLASMGNIHIRNGDYDDALRCFEQAAAYDSENALLHTNIAFVKFKMQKYTEAAEEYEKVLTYRPDMVYAHMSLASIYEKFTGQPDKASYHRAKCTEIRRFSSPSTRED